MKLNEAFVKVLSESRLKDKAVFFMKDDEIYGTGKISRIEEGKAIVNELEIDIDSLTVSEDKGVYEYEMTLDESLSSYFRGGKRGGSDHKAQAYAALEGEFDHNKLTWALTSMADENGHLADDEQMGLISVMLKKIKDAFRQGGTDAAKPVVDRAIKRLS